MATVGEIGINVVARTGKLRKGMRRSQGMLSKFKQSATRSLVGIGGVMAAAFSVRAIKGFVREQMAAIDANAKFARAVGASVEGLQGLRHAASLAGVSTSQMDTALRRMMVGIGEAAIGTGEAQEAIRALGLEATSLQTMGADRALLKIAERFKDIEGAADRARIAADLFGTRGGLAMLQLLESGPGGIRAGMADAQRLGLTTSMSDARAVERANDAFTRLSAAIKGVGIQLAVGIAPTLEFLAKDLTAVVAGLDSLKGAGSTVGSALLSLSSVLDFAGSNIRGWWNGVQSALWKIGQWASWLAGGSREGVGLLNQKSLDAWDRMTKQFGKSVDILTGKTGAGRKFARRPMDDADAMLGTATEMARAARGIAGRANLLQALGASQGKVTEFMRKAQEMQSGAIELVREVRDMAASSQDAPTATARELSRFMGVGARFQTQKVKDPDMLAETKAMHNTLAQMHNQALFGLAAATGNSVNPNFIAQYVP